MTVWSFFYFAGGVGLFLLGMKLMTDGLRVAAGGALREILARWTTSFPRAAGSGFLITAMMQSSTAVIFATIGFVNAGFLNLFQAISVIIGSAVGTTMTSWLVVMVGFDLDIKSLALPLIALGMFLHVLVPGQRRGALGLALTGFGVFFLGLDLLRDIFGDVQDTFHFGDMEVSGYLSLFPFLIAGFLMTVAMQSSSAALAVTLTAAAGGVIPLSAGAAVVIGANIGTTSTSLFAAIGATPNARRAALGHVIFNLTTGAAAFLVLPLVLMLVIWLTAQIGLAERPVVALAMFHTLIQIFGLLLFWPFTARLVTILQARFRTQEEDLGRPRYLDTMVVSVPSLAVDAVYRELLRIGERARDGVKHALSSETGNVDGIENDRRVVGHLALAVGNFTREVQKADLPDEIAEALPASLRVTQYYLEMTEMAAEIIRLHTQLGPASAAVEQQTSDFKRDAVALIDATDPEREDYHPEHYEKAMQAFQDRYQALKASLLQAGTRGELPIARMSLRLEQISNIRRAMDQAVKAARYLRKLERVQHEHD